MVTIFRLTTQRYAVWANEWVGQKITTVCRPWTAKRWRGLQLFAKQLRITEAYKHYVQITVLQYHTQLLWAVCPPFSWTSSSFGSIQLLLVLHSAIQFPSLNLSLSYSPWAGPKCLSCHHVPCFLPTSGPPVPIFYPLPTLSVHCSYPTSFPNPFCS